MTMSTAAVLNRYKNVQVKTSSPGEILVMLYDGLFRFLGEAKTAMEAGDRGTAGARISRSHEILALLDSGLKPSIAPELCANLEALYVFSMHHIVQANIEQNPDKLTDVLRVLTPLREAWTIVVRGAKVDAPANGSANIASLSAPITIK
jgi:flagellar protein FliS